MATQMIARDRGFALVEALASLAIVALMSLMLVDGVGSGRRVWDRVEAGSNSADALASAQTLLRDRIEQLYPATSHDQTPPYVDFDGAPASLAFLAQPPMAARPTSLRRYRLLLTSTGDLVLTSEDDAVDASVRRLSAAVLLRGVQRLDIAYFGADASDPQASWRESWRRQPRPPRVIRIRVAFFPGDRRWWPDLIVRPMPTVDSDCGFNPAAGGRCAIGG